jgi:CHAT domain-containing protein
MKRPTSTLRKQQRESAPAYNENLPSLRNENNEQASLLSVDVSLVVSSGCETALGKLSSGDELVGLIRAFIYAGTPSVVVSLWKVDDASTASLMSSFYKNLKTTSKAESLRQAQLDMIRGAVDTRLLAQRGVGGIGKLGQTPLAQSSISISTSYPYFWAPFILVGDGK